MSPTSQKVYFTLVSMILRRPPRVFNTVVFSNDRIWPGDLFAFLNLKLTQVPSFNKVCKSNKFQAQPILQQVENGNEQITAYKSYKEN